MATHEQATSVGRTAVSLGLGLFGQLVIGPPGSGKTTYCAAMANFLIQLGRNVTVVNLDPANDRLPYECAINIADLIRLDEVMDNLHLGPNGGLVFCMDYLYANRDWLGARLVRLCKQGTKPYCIFDLPGQVELYTHHPSMRQLVAFLTDLPNSGSSSGGLSVDTSTASVDARLPTPASLGLHLTAVHLIDSHYCADAGKFISCLLTSLAAMLQLSLPHVNVLSKVDLVEQFGPLDFSLDFFTEVLDLNYLIERMEEEGDAFYVNYKRLNQALVNLVQDQSLVQFVLLDIQEMSHLERLMRYADRANGYVFGPDEQHNLQSLLHSASGVELTSDWIGMAQEKYMQSETESETPAKPEPEIDLFS